MKKNWEVRQINAVATNELLGVTVEVPQEYHVLPINDIREHETTGDCWCDPAIEVNSKLPLVVHNSADQRELKENAN